MMTENWDIVHLPRDKYSTMECRVCKGNMDVERDTRVPNTFPGNFSQCDKFTCQDAAEKWHEQAKAILQDIADIPSRRLADMMQDEVDQILQERETTKTSWKND